MPSHSLDSLRRPLGFVPTLLVNLVPLAGVLVLDWNPVTLIAVYTLEVLVSFPIAAGKALFAQQPPRSERNGVFSVSEATLTTKRGAVTVFPWLPPVYPRNLSFSMSVVGAGLGFVLVIAIAVATRIPLDTAVWQPGVLLSAGALVLSQLFDVWWDYLGNERFRDATPYSVVETLGRQAFFLFVLFVAAPVPEENANPVVLLAVFVGFKILVEWSTYWTTHSGDGGGRLSGWLAGPDPNPDAERDLTLPPGKPVARFQTDTTATAYAALFETLAGPAWYYAHGIGIVWLVSLLVYFDGQISPTLFVCSALLALVLYIAGVGLKTAAYYSKYAPLEYRCYGQTLVAYDTWLDEPQWSTPVDLLTDTEVVQDRLSDRLCETRTLVTDTGWGDETTTRILGPLRDPQAVVETLDLPVASTDVGPIDYKLAALTVVGLSGSCLAVVALSAGDGGFGRSLVALFFLLPFVGAVSKGLWKRSYPSVQDSKTPH